MNQTYDCPRIGVSNASLPFNVSSKFNDAFELNLFICAYTAYNLYVNNAYHLLALAIVPCSILGFVGSILVLITLRNKQKFNALCFIYFRVINLTELIYLSQCTAKGVVVLFADQCSASYFCIFFNFIYQQAANVFAVCANLLVIFLSVERAVACALVTYFHYINHTPVYWVYLSASILVSLIICIPQIFAYKVQKSNLTGVYSLILSNFAQTQFYATFLVVHNAFFYAQSIIAVVTTIMSIIGLAVAMRRQYVY